MRKEVLHSIIDDLQAGKTPDLASEDFPCFSDEELAGKGVDAEAVRADIAAHLTAADIPTFQRAVRAIEEGDLAWLGFKLVLDADAAQRNVDNDVTKKYGDVGSADGEPLMFFCNDAKEIVAARDYSARDTFQMKDVTRGPSMHNDQFEGLTWVSVPLHDKVTVWLLGASDAASEVSALAHHVGFRVVAVDYDASYLSADRFADAECILLPSMELEDLTALPAKPEDYVCVLTRGHMFDPQSCVWATRVGAHYIGMMGCKGKNNTVYDLVRAAGVTDEQWEAIKRPIGLKFGAKTPAELAIAIVAELIDVRYQQRYSEEARSRHDSALGR